LPLPFEKKNRVLKQELSKVCTAGIHEKSHHGTGLGGGGGGGVGGGMGKKALKTVKEMRTPTKPKWWPLLESLGRNENRQKKCQRKGSIKKKGGSQIDNQTYARRN